jgi:DNA-binding protein YbaB
MSASSDRLCNRIDAVDQVSLENTYRAQAYAAMGEELKSVTGEAGSPDGAVTVVAGAGGSIADVRFTDAIQSLPPRDLARSVLTALRQAQAEATRKQAEVVRDRLGGTEELASVIDYDERLFGTPQPHGPGESPGEQVRATHASQRRSPDEGSAFSETFTPLGDTSAR